MLPYLHKTYAKLPSRVQVLAGFCLDLPGEPLPLLRAEAQHGTVRVLGGSRTAMALRKVAATWMQLPPLLPL